MIDQSDFDRILATIPKKLSDGTDGSKCTKDALIFAQYTCEITEEEKEAKYTVVSIVSVLSMFVSFLFSQLIFFLQ